MEKKRVIVIGAGPAGLAAALGALKEGASVFVLEHMPQPGIKLLLTGNGQCNLSNTEAGMARYHGNTEVIRTVCESFSFSDMIRFMEELGVETETVRYRHEPCGYLYPSDHKAETVRNAMVSGVLAAGGEIMTGCEIQDICPVGESCCGTTEPESCSLPVTGVESSVEAENSGIPERKEDRASETEHGISFRIKTNKGVYIADAVIFATGSNAYPKTGSDSSIYPVLKKLGIIQKPWLPALTALRSDSPFLRTLKGLRAEASAVLKDETTGEVFETNPGEIQFRDHYISGIPVLQLSRYAAIGLRDRHEVRLYVHLRKATNRDGVLPLEKAVFNVTGTEGFERAICCSGGIGAADINAETLGSTRYGNMFFAGEMIDVDGDCGGFNLHFAIASGLLAGRNAAG